MESIIPSINLIAAGILFGVIQIIILGYIFISKKQSRKHAYFLAFLGVILIAQTESFLNRSGLMISVPHLLNIATPFIFLLGPLLFLYTKSWINPEGDQRKTVLHFIPFIFYFCYSFFFYLQPEAYKYNAFVSSFRPLLDTVLVQSPFSPDPWNIQGIVVVELLSLHILCYSTLTLITLKRFKKSQSQKGLEWLTFGNSMLGFGGVIMLLSQGGIINGNRFFEELLPTFSADLFPTFATYAISIFLFKNGLPSGLKQPKYYKSVISKELRNSQLEKVIETLESQRLFTNPNFSLKLLSESSGLSTHHISQALNEEMGCTFFELTNKYRIEEAKKLLANNSGYIKMEQLAYELGYKSKSTFFTAFKKSTQLTPSKFRESIIN